MSDARSLTPLSQADYEAIEAAVMETARGRWFMAEYAKRNRQADTKQLLSAISRIERVVGLSVAETSRETNLIEAAALIHDLRSDLARISGRSEDRSSGLAAQIESAAGAILTATESIQEVAWVLRESGAEGALCDRLDWRSAEISGAVGAIDAVVQRMDKIADTIAMLDSSLRAFGEASYAPTTRLDSDEAPASHAAPPAPAEPAAAQEPAGEAAPPVLQPLDDLPVGAHRLGTVELLDDDLVFSEPVEPPPYHPAGLASTSEIGLRELDAMQADRKLAYFA